MVVANRSGETELTDAQWQIADAIARQLVLDEVDLNELRKAISYLRSTVERENAGENFFSYLKTLVRQGDTISHSKRTIDYYRNLDIICNQYLENYQGDAPKMLFLLGWADRLAKYYKDGSPVGELKVPEIKSEREIELKAITEANDLKIGQLVEATITAIKNSKVTYEMLGGLKQSPKEPQLLKRCELSVGQSIKVEIIDLKEDGSIRKVKGRCPEGCTKQS